MTRLLCLVLLLASCARAPLTDISKAFRLAKEPDIVRDAFDLGSLRIALERTLKSFEGAGVPDEFVFDDRAIKKEDYRRSLEKLRPELENWDRFTVFVRKNFNFYEVYGTDTWGEVFSTGYYEPIIEASDSPTPKLSRPIYRTPPDLVQVDLVSFSERNPKSEALKNLLLDSRGPRPTWKARISESNKVVPYYLRHEIDGQKVLEGKKLEIAWMDPIDSFFLEIQGSGVLQTPKRRFRVGYSNQNGAGYEAIGKFLTDVIPLPEMSMQRIRAHLATLKAEQRDEILFKNPSYVFFQELSSEAMTVSGAEATAQRTIATDQYLLPKGVLGFLQIDLPDFTKGDEENLSWLPAPRFVFNQDTGGAIRGGGRVDLYMGTGELAARLGGVMKRNGHLWMLAPTDDFLQTLGEK